MINKATGRSRGFENDFPVLSYFPGIGFVRFTSISDAVKARNAMNGYRLSEDAEALVGETFPSFFSIAEFSVKYAECDEVRAVRRAKLQANQTAAAARHAARYYAQVSQRVRFHFCCSGSLTCA